MLYRPFALHESVTNDLLELLPGFVAWCSPGVADCVHFDDDGKCVSNRVRYVDYFFSF